MKKIILIGLCILFTLPFVINFEGHGFPGPLCSRSYADDEKSDSQKSICPKTLMAKDCLTCHVVPDFRLKESKPDAHFDYPYGVKVFDTRGYFLVEEITNNTSNHIRDFLDYLRNHKIKHAVIDVHSSGGALFAAWRIKGLINEFQDEGGIVETKVRGLAASAGTIIFLAGTKGHRIANPQSELMFHELWSIKFIAVETPSDKEDEARVFRHFQDTISLWLATRGHLSKNEIDQRIKKKEFWFTGKEAFDWGFVDRLTIGN